jgi:uncharacterized protein YlxP (DUF503 family)
VSAYRGAWVGVLTFVVATPGARSLKDKRGLITPIVERTRRRFPVSVARLDGLDRLDRETLGAVVISADPEVCRSVLDRVRAFAESFGLRIEEVRSEVDRWD